MLDQLDIKTNYSSSSDDLIEAFYKPCLGSSVVYNRATGYFSSGIMTLLNRPIAEFVSRGGKIRLVCSHQFSEQDIENIQAGYDWKNTLDQSLLKEIDQALDEPHGKAVLNFVSCLIATNALDVSIAFKPGSRGIYHAKKGVFGDSAGNLITFSGSINESYTAWSTDGNHEEFEVFKSWSAENDRALRHAREFERLWNDQEPNLSVHNFPDVAREKLVTSATDRDPVAAYEKYVMQVSSLPSARSPRKTPHKHQLDAIEAWRKNGKRGILKHATGSGKTFSAILAIAEWIEDHGPAIVLVPSTLLLDQWYDQIKSTLSDSDVNIVRVGGGHSGWRGSGYIESLTADDIGNRSVVLATLQTASGHGFIARVSQGDHLFLVCDEVHWSGAEKNSTILKIDSGGRLGLSATPERYRDPEGTRDIFDYFGDVVHEFTLRQAIEAGRLCRYNYHMRFVQLSDAEFEEWGQLSTRIRQMYAIQNTKRNPDSSSFKSLDNLMIRRARIVKRAEAKQTIPGDILQEFSKPEHRWLVYCEDQDQLSDVAADLRARGINFDQYHSYMESDRGAVLKKFATTGGVLVAIRCLDEGVDIPEITHAIIIASSQNPRQFIQRRGRVLRTSPGKSLAVIYDVLVEPPKGSPDVSETANLIKTEIARALQFAEDSDNPSVKITLWDWASQLGIHDLCSEITGYLEEETDFEVKDA